MRHWTKEEWYEKMRDLFIRSPRNNELPVETEWVKSPTVGKVYRVPIRSYFQDAGFSRRQSDYLAVAFTAVCRAKYPTKKFVLEEDGKWLVIGPYRMDETLYKILVGVKGLLFEFYKFLYKTNKEGDGS